MLEIPKILFRRIQAKVLRYKWPYLIMATLLVVLLSAKWDPADERLHVLGFIDLTKVIPYVDREEAFAYLFDDFFAPYWMAVVALFLPKWILGEVLHSFTVSNRLYLKMSPANDRDLAIYRVVLILFGALLYCLIPLVGALIFCTVKQFSIRGPIISIIGLLAHILWIGGFMLVFSMSHTSELSERKRLMYFFIFMPILFYIFGNKVADLFDGFFPMTGPYLFRTEGFKIVKPFCLALAMGILSLSWHVFKAHLKTRKYYQRINRYK